MKQTIIMYASIYSPVVAENKIDIFHRPELFGLNANEAA